jgi:hypothetical protein
VGALNPLAVEMAAPDGAKIVRMPAFDAANEQELFKRASRKNSSDEFGKYDVSG